MASLGCEALVDMSVAPSAPVCGCTSGTVPKVPFRLEGHSGNGACYTDTVENGRAAPSGHTFCSVRNSSQKAGPRILFGGRKGYRWLISRHEAQKVELWIPNPVVAGSIPAVSAGERQPLEGASLKAMVPGPLTATVAQLVGNSICNRDVAGSSPAGGSASCASSAANRVTDERQTQLANFQLSSSKTAKSIEPEPSNEDVLTQ